VNDTTYELVPIPEKGRRYSAQRTVRLGDTTISGRLRLDALARYLQDVAGDDVGDAGIEGPWVMRRLALELGKLPRFRDTVELVTFCSGTGRRWAERRTTMSVDGRVAAEAVAIWVYVDPVSGAPMPLEDWFFDLYGEAAGGRRVSGRLRLPAPHAGADARPWPLRVTDFDVLGHVNNAAHWEPVEEQLAHVTPGARMTAAELEHKAAVEQGEELTVRSVVSDGAIAVWLTSGDLVRTAARVTLSEAGRG
jgi:acyl-ACP thioesterase